MGVKRYMQMHIYVCVKVNVNVRKGLTVTACIHSAYVYMYNSQNFQYKITLQ